MPAYLQDAVPTSIGNAHPISGYQLDSNKGLSSLAAYYAPNHGPYTFIDPAASATPAQLVFFQRDSYGSLGVDFAFHSWYQDLTNVAWDFGDGNTQAAGNWQARHVYAAAGSYTVQATGTSTASGAVSASVTVVVDNVMSKPVNTVAPALSTQTPTSGTAVTVTTGTWTNAGVYSYQWYDDTAAISGATTNSYTPVAGDVGKILSVKVTNTNSLGATSVTVAAGTAVA